ncbi:MAG: amino acid adenylation domain-containing protein [Anaerolineae bacterium]
MIDMLDQIKDLSPEKRRLLELMLKEAGVELERAVILPQPRTTNTWPTSYAQQRLWLIDQLEPGSAVYNIPLALRLTGRLDLDVLERALNEVVHRHEILRTTFDTANQAPVQIVAPVQHVPLFMIDLQSLPAIDREAEALRLAHVEAQRPFDLTSGPLLRAQVLRLTAADHIVLITLHHIATDGWSMGVLLNEVVTLYTAFTANQPSPLPDLSIQYADYATWQRDWLKGEVLDQQLTYWKEQLANCPPRLELPADRPRPATQTTHGAQVLFAVPPSVRDKLLQLSQQNDSTLFMTLLAAFQVLLYRYTGQDDLCVGTPVANRQRTETEPLIGFFVNTLVIRGDLSGQPSFRDLLQRVRAVTLAAYDHQDLPFDLLLDELQPERDPSYSPLFQVMFALQNAPRREVPLPDVTLTLLPTHSATSKFDLSLILSETTAGLEGSIEYNTDLFDEATLDRMVAHFIQLLTSIVAQPDRSIATLPIVPEAEQHRLLIEWTATAQPYGRERCIHQVFEDQVARVPDTLAVVDERQSLTYRELNRRANQLAHHLQQLGVGPDTPIGVCLDRSVEVVISLLGILKAGGAYVPFDPTYPTDRLQFMLADSHVTFMLTQQKFATAFLNQASDIRDPKLLCLDTDWALIAAESDENPITQVTSSNLAYILYTSGSTGRPKGVCCQHQGVINLLTDFERYQPIDTGEACSWWTSLNFDVSVYEIFSPLLTGGTLHIVPETARAESVRCFEWLQAHNIQSAYLPPFMIADFAAWVQADASPLDLRRLLVGVEPIREPLLAAISARLPKLRILNGYGPTEATVCCTLYPVKADHAPNRNTPIGKPLANTQIYLLDSQLQPVPIGVPGEVYIGGDGLARGYLNQPELTAEKFILNPFGELSPAFGGRLYKTGDLARWLPDGNIEFIGRTDFQVKVRGYRIELGEIEAVLNQHPDVRKSVVLVWPGEADGDKRLAAYVVAPPESTLTPDALREFARVRLPDYMLPSAFTVLDTLPITANGKVDRRALPVPNWSVLNAEHVAPRTPTEELLCGLWSQILKIERVGITDNFFALGGHSLLATQIVSRVREAWQIDLPLKQIFEAPTIATLAEKIDTLRSVSRVDLQPIVPLASGEIPSLSFAQQRLWFLDQLEPDTAFYNIPEVVRLDGALNITALTDSLNEVIRRHSVLRSTFLTIDGEPHLVIVPDLRLLPPVIDLQGIRETERESAAQRLIRDEAQRPFDLANGPLVRATLLKLAADQHIALLTLHHSVSDGWSTTILINELATLYTAYVQSKPSPLPELPIQYADFAHWQRQWLQGEVIAKELNYWQQQLSGCATALNLPTDRPRPAMQTSRGAHYQFALSDELTQSLKDLSRREGATLFMTLLAAYQTLLYRYTGQDDINIGTPIANRTRAEVENLIGCFVNTLVLRGDLSSEPPFRELLKRTRDATLGAYAHQAVPFEKVVDAVQPERDLSRTPLFQVMFVLQNVPSQPITLPGLTLTHLQPESGVSNFDLTLVLEETADGLSGAIEYSTDLFDADTIERLAEHFELLLTSIVADPDRSIATLPLLADHEQHQLLIEWNATHADYAHDRCVHQLIEAQAERTPRAIAIAAGDKTVTYRELNRRSNQLAHYLQKLGVGPDQLVGLCVERSVEMLIGLLGILKAGGAYVPLDPTYPADRIAFMLTDSHTAVVVTQQHHAHLFSSKSEIENPKLVCLDTDWQHIASESVHHPTGPTSPDQLAYVIYTSGSTGKPKGVMITHRSLVNHNQAVAREFGLTPADRVLQFATINFDTAAEEIYPTWISGATLVLPPPGLLTVDDLHALIEREHLTVLDLPTAYWHAWTHELTLSPRTLPPALRLVIVGGEKALAERYIEWQQVTGGRIRWLNTYGPTEGTIIASVYEPLSSESLTTELPIGRPIANAKLYVLDPHLQPTPIGVPGELHIGGLTVARGYLNQTDLTNERFIPDPFGDPAAAVSGRLYKTGDLARVRADGNIEYLGRIDQQVKIRGFRIEPGEIETRLREHPAVSEAVVIAREDTPGDRRLVAYIVPTPTQTISAAELRSFIATRLPDYMRPTAFVMLEALPLTPNHKVDRRKLPAPDQIRAEPTATYAAPESADEKTLAAIWSQVLGVSQVGRHDNFFELGGDSILSIQVVARANQAGLHFTPKQLFERPTVAGLAAVSTKARTIHAEAGLVEGAMPLTPIQHWFFEQALRDPHHWNQALMFETPPLDQSRLMTTTRYWLNHHDALRLRFGRADSGWQAIIRDGDGAVPVTWIDLRRLPLTAQREAVEQHATAIQGSLNLSEGPLLRVAYFDLGPQQPGRLLFAIHHLVVDGVSWRILLEDFQTLYAQLSHRQPVRLPPKTTSLQYWAARLEAYAQTPEVVDQLPYWLNALSGPLNHLPLDFADGDNIEAATDHVVVTLTSAETQALLHDVPAAYHTEINDALVTALALALSGWARATEVLIDLEGHGREDLFDEIDLSRTVGWFTTLTPLRLNLKGTAGPGEALKSIKEQLRRLPQHGLSYGLLRYLHHDREISYQLRGLNQPQVAFNYLGQFDQLVSADSAFKAATEPIGAVHSPRAQRYHILEINGGVMNGCLSLDWTYSTNLHRRETIERVANDFIATLRTLIAHCQSPEAGGYTPSDFKLAPIDQRQLDKLLTRLDRSKAKALP